MKAARIAAAGKAPTYGELVIPEAGDGEDLIAVRASAISSLTRARASGAHYSAAGEFPLVPGIDGVGLTRDGRRVYFVLPEPPHGALAEWTVVRAERCVAVPDAVNDVTAAAIANPGMSSWAALVKRAQLRAGETVLVNGATGTAGRLAVQLAKHLGAARVIATGRNDRALGELRGLGADETVRFALDESNGARAFEQALLPLFAAGVDVVVDYLWGDSASAIIAAIARASAEGHPVRFVQVGTAGGQADITLPGAALRSSAIVMMGSGLKSVPLPALLGAVRHVFDAVGPAHLEIATRVEPLSNIAAVWATAGGQPRLVFTMQG